MNRAAAAAGPRYGQGRLSRGGTHQNPGTPYPFRNLSCYCRQSLTSSISTKPAVCRTRPPLVRRAWGTPHGQEQGQGRGDGSLCCPTQASLHVLVSADRQLQLCGSQRQGRPCGWGGCKGWPPVQAEWSRARYSAAVLTSTCIVLSSALVVTAVGTSRFESSQSEQGLGRDAISCMQAATSANSPYDLPPLLQPAWAS